MPEAIDDAAGRATAWTAGPSAWPAGRCGPSTPTASTCSCASRATSSLHSHLRMTGSWSVYRDGQRWRRSPRRAWLVLRARGHEVVEFDGPVLELMTEARTRFDPRVAALGPDILADPFDADALPAPAAPRRPHARHRRRAARPAHRRRAREHVEGRGAAGGRQVDPWRPVREVTDAEAMAVLEASGRACAPGALGPREHDGHGVYNRAGRPCPRCGARVRARGQGDDNRTTFWCPGCQTLTGASATRAPTPSCPATRPRPSTPRSRSAST